ncbi:MAG: hypothetical protein HQL72_03500 [Magnetococcales bacterium]|nr:hypothetical protein [Magnetococcales bacterium]
MIFKILIPLLAIATVYFLGKSHARKEQARGVALPRPVGQIAEKGSTFQLAAYAVALSVAGLAGWYIYADWRESKMMVRIRVINAETGQVALYDAPKGLVFGRAFTTQDGRRVTLADVERMEVQPIE